MLGEGLRKKLDQKRIYRLYGLDQIETVFLFLLLVIWGNKKGTK